MDSNVVLHIILTAVLFVNEVKPLFVCYDVVGCFHNNYPYNTIELPQDPADKKTEFLIFTRQNREAGEHVTYHIPATVANSHFNPTRNTKVISHGFRNALDDTQWIIDMKDALLDREDVNVIVLDYSDWAKVSLSAYDQAVANIRLVATQLKLLLSMMQTNFSLEFGDVHLIGHSLGAHLSGYVGSYLRKEIGETVIARISGIDPANPDFRKETSTDIRLDPTDAIFVDVIHTSGKAAFFNGGFGTDIQSGHTDFYINDEKHQPGCKDGIVGAVKGVWEKMFTSDFSDDSLPTVIGDEASCSHSRAHHIFIESIKEETSFVAYPCQNYEKFLSGTCLDRHGENITRAGYSADQYGAKGKSYLKTFDTEPLSGHHYHVSLTAHSSTVDTRGTLHVSLTDQDDGIVWSTLSEKNQELHNKTSINQIVLTHKLVSPMRGVHLKFEKADPILWVFRRNPDYFIVDSVDIFNGGTQKRYTSSQSEIRLQDDERVWIELEPDVDTDSAISIEDLVVG